MSCGLWVVRCQLSVVRNFYSPWTLGYVYEVVPKKNTCYGI
ncbi:MAG: hypothetical protein ACKOQN_20000 [Dolichospermum sp.]